MDRNNGGVFIIWGRLLRNEREIFGARTPLANLNAPEQRGRKVTYLTERFSQPAQCRRAVAGRQRVTRLASSVRQAWTLRLDSAVQLSRLARRRKPAWPDAHS
jgi:hypothetical protein